jgi:DNA-binding beta-propeller fold protein YncE
MLYFTKYYESLKKTDYRKNRTESESMKIKTIISIVLLSIVMILSAVTSGFAAGDVEWNVLKTLQLEAIPIDVAITPDGRRIYVLTDQGEILVYSSTQTVEGRIEVGKHVDQLKLGPRGETLILSSGQDKTIQIVTIDFIQNIDTTGAPFMGREDAPVVIAVFNDFQ